ncbi:MAG TPA: TIGR04282 family arsenosugar biosynthesis glycosyltransferase [Azonexus sp.]
MTTEAVTVAILAKAPRPGFAKTRLIPRLGAAGAAALQDWLLRRTVATAVAAQLGPVTLWGAPDGADPAFAAVAGGSVTVHDQPAGDLGIRLLAAVAAGPTLLLGTDCPALTPAILRRAAGALAHHDAVAIPAEDGGYVLLGLHRADPSLFTGIAWSTAQVMAQTRQRLQQLGWRWLELPALWDVDRPDDLGRLLAAWPATADFACPGPP